MRLQVFFEFYLDCNDYLIYNLHVLDEDKLYEEVFLSLTYRAMPMFVRDFLYLLRYSTSEKYRTESSAWTTEAKRKELS